MGVKLNLNQSAIKAKMKDAEEAILQKFLRVLRYCGEMAVNEARTNAGYTDQTGNLKASIGYVISVNGKILENSFAGKVTVRKKDGTADMRYTVSRKEWSDGRKVGYDLAREIAMSKPDIALIVVAGMKYASHVESKGRNVLTSAEQMASRIVPELLKQLR